MKKILVIFTSVLSLFFLLTACNEQSSSSDQSGSQQTSSVTQSSTQTISPKQLISKEDATTFLGESLKEGLENDQISFLGMKSCIYLPEKSDSKNYLMIAIASSSTKSKQSVSGEQSSSSKSGNHQSSGQESPKNIYEGLKKVFADPNMVITGYMGDDSFMLSQGLSILSGDNYIYIAVGNTDPTKKQQILKQAGNLAIKNLKRIQEQ